MAARSPTMDTEVFFAETFADKSFEPYAEKYVESLIEQTSSGFSSIESVHATMYKWSQDNDTELMMLPSGGDEVVNWGDSPMISPINIHELSDCHEKLRGEIKNKLNSVKRIYGKGYSYTFEPSQMVTKNFDKGGQERSFILKMPAAVFRKKNISGIKAVPIYTVSPEIQHFNQLRSHANAISALVTQPSIICPGVLCVSPYSGCAFYMQTRRSATPYQDIARSVLKKNGPIKLNVLKQSPIIIKASNRVIVTNDAEDPDSSI